MICDRRMMHGVGGGGGYFPDGQNTVWRHALAIGCLALIHELMWGNF